MEHPAQKIKFLMRTGGFSIYDLSDKLGVTTECLRDILDEREMPTPQLLYNVCTIFGVKEDYFEEAMRRGPRPRGDAEKEPVLERAPDRERPRSGAPATARPAAGGSAPVAVKEARPSARAHRKVDLAEVVARQHALVDLLVSKNVFTRDEYETRLEILRAKAIARKAQR